MPPPKYLPTHELYAEQLLPLQLGYALYEPDRGPEEDEVRIGDIGHILNGRFERIASVFKLGNGVKVTVEEEYRKINSYGDIDGPTLSSKNIENMGIEAEGGVTAAGNPVRMTFKVSRESTSGASLVKKYRATDEKSAFPNVLQERFDGCVQSVYEFAKGKKLPVTDLHNIILVTGRVMTGDWATIAFRNRSKDTNIAFHIHTPVAGAGLSLWGKWSEEITFPRKIGPRRSGNAPPDGEEPAFDQCIFIETYRTYHRPWYERLKSTIRVAQKKGPSEKIDDVRAGNFEGNTSGSPSSVTMPSQTGEVSGAGAGDDVEQIVLTAYDVLAFEAFRCTNAEFEFICIDEEDVKRLLPTSATLISVLENILDVSEYIIAKTEADQSDSEVRGKMGKLYHSQFYGEIKTLDSVRHPPRRSLLRDDNFKTNNDLGSGKQTTNEALSRQQDVKVVSEFEDRIDKSPVERGMVRGQPNTSSVAFDSGQSPLSATLPSSPTLVTLRIDAVLGIKKLLATRRKHVTSAELYAKQLLPLGYGYPLFDPDPGFGRKEVHIGDVGYISDGRFIRIANVFETGNGITTALEERFRKSTFLADLDKGVLSSKGIRMEGVEEVLSGFERTPSSSTSISAKFHCRSGEGAMLITKYRSKVETTTYHKQLEERYAKNLKSVYDYAKSNGFEPGLRDIVLVTGRVLTGDWATIVFDSQNQDSTISFSFDMKATIPTARGKPWGRWSGDGFCPQRVGPLRQHAIADDEEPVFDQCIFIDTYQFSDLPLLSRFLGTVRTT